MIADGEKRLALNAVIDILGNHTLAIHSVSVEAVWRTVSEDEDTKIQIDTGVRVVNITFTTDPDSSPATIGKQSDDELTDPYFGLDLG